MTVDARIDAYIAKAAPFAVPILTHLRAAVHAACPQVEETIRWGMPSFTYNGSILCQMAAFKAHASFGFWQREQATGAASAKDKEAMGQFGRLTTIADLPSDTALAAMIERAMAVVDSKAKAPRPVKHPKPPVALPDDLAVALAAVPAAQATYDGFPEGQKRDYVEWITAAKRAETRASRIADAVAWMAEGKRRNWKYERC